MTKSKFISILKRAIKFQAKPQNVPCRCVGCYNERQKRQGKIASVALK